LNNVTNGASDLAGARVMVIDDSNTIRRSAEIFLLKAGCEVILAEDGFDALAKITDHQPQVIFVDIMMPRLDGYQTCALIKKNPRLRKFRSSCCRARMACSIVHAVVWSARMNI
jgi:CheY-like chemotaxis protein